MSPKINKENSFQPDEIDKAILNAIQVDFPINSRPFQIIAQRLSLKENEVINRIRRMKDKQIIRRIGGNFSPNRLGYFSTLCAAKVKPEKIRTFTETVNSYQSVTHNYIREHPFNVWFTIIAASSKIIQKQIKEISQKTGVNTILNLPATHVFKISANFKL